MIHDWGFSIGDFFAARDWVFSTESALAFAGVVFAIWAGYHIAQYWSAGVALRADDQLIRSGPYGRIRHPIYPGMLLVVFGTALAIGRWRALVACAMVLAAFTEKSKREEKLPASQFGSAFDEHRRRTGFFPPRFYEAICLGVVQACRAETRAAPASPSVLYGFVVEPDLIRVRPQSFYAKI